MSLPRASLWRELARVLERARLRAEAPARRERMVAVAADCWPAAASPTLAETCLDTLFFLSERCVVDEVPEMLPWNRAALLSVLAEETGAQVPFLPAEHLCLLRQMSATTQQRTAEAGAALPWWRSLAGTELACLAEGYLDQNDLEKAEQALSEARRESGEGRDPDVQLLLALAEARLAAEREAPAEAARQVESAATLAKAHGLEDRRWLAVTIRRASVALLDPDQPPARQDVLVEALVEALLYCERGPIDGLFYALSLGLAAVGREIGLPRSGLSYLDMAGCFEHAGSAPLAVWRQALRVLLKSKGEPLERAEQDELRQAVRRLRALGFEADARELGSEVPISPARPSAVIH